MPRHTIQCTASVPHSLWSCPSHILWNRTLGRFKNGGRRRSTFTLSPSSLSGSIQTNATAGATVQGYPNPLPHLLVGPGYRSERLQETQHRVGCFGDGELLHIDTSLPLSLLFQRGGTENGLTPDAQTRTTTKRHKAPARHSPMDMLEYCRRMLKVASKAGWPKPHQAA